MLLVDIPGRENLKLENLVLDYNGTIAVDGNISIRIKEMLEDISKFLKVYILTADTYGTVEKQCKDLDVSIKIFANENAAKCKKDIVKSLDGQTVCIGNGYNDIEMFKISDLSIAVIGEEGCCGKLINYADIIVKSPIDALELILNPNRIKATLRG